jgi:hypothetical protein
MPVAVFEVAEEARLEVEAATHPVVAEVDGQVLATTSRSGKKSERGRCWSCSMPSCRV